MRNLDIHEIAAVAGGFPTTPPPMQPPTGGLEGFCGQAVPLGTIEQFCSGGPAIPQPTLPTAPRADGA